MSATHESSEEAVAMDSLDEAERYLTAVISHLIGRASIANADEIGADSAAVFAASSHVTDLTEARRIVRDVRARLKANRE